MDYPKLRFGSLILTIVIFYLQVGPSTGGDSIKMTSLSATLHSQTIKSQTEAASRQDGDAGFAATERQSSMPHQGGEHIKSVSVSPLSLYIRFWRFAFFILLWSGAAILLSLGIGYFWRRKDQGAAIFAFYAREALGGRQWWMWLLIVTAVFLISNHLLVRGLAVGVWDVNDSYYPYQVLVADFARAGRLLQWDPWSNGGMPLGS